VLLHTKGGLCNNKTEKEMERMKEVFVPVLAEKLEALAIKKFDKHIEVAGAESEALKREWEISEELFQELDAFLVDEEMKNKLFLLRDQISNVSTFESQDAYVAGFLEGMLYFQELRSIQESVISAVKERKGYKYA